MEFTGPTMMDIHQMEQLRSEMFQHILKSHQEKMLGYERDLI